MVTAAGRPRLPKVSANPLRIPRSLTGSTFAVLTGYAWVSRRDFSALGGFLTVGVWVLLGTMLLNFFFQNAGAGLWIAAVALAFTNALGSHAIARGAHRAGIKPVQAVVDRLEEVGP